MFWIWRMLALERGQWGQGEEYDCRPLCVRIFMSIDGPKAAVEIMLLHPVWGFHV